MLSSRHDQPFEIEHNLSCNTGVSQISIRANCNKAMFLFTADKQCVCSRVLRGSAQIQIFNISVEVTDGSRSFIYFLSPSRRGILLIDESAKFENDDIQCHPDMSRHQSDCEQSIRHAMRVSRAENHSADMSFFNTMRNSQ